MRPSKIPRKTKAAFTSTFIQSTLKTKPHGKGGSTYSSIISDSRQAEPGCLFVALAGERVDGHEYINQAIQKGANGIICDQEYDFKIHDLKRTVFYPVKDTLIAYRKLAHTWRLLFKIPVILIAGSVGKTTSKELAAAILKGKFKNPLKTEGSENGFIGIPMTLLKLKPKNDVAIIEVGIDDIGAMKNHLELVRPTTAWVTQIGEEHLEKLKNIETVYKEETLALTWTLKHRGSVILNMADSWIVKLATMHRMSRSKSKNIYQYHINNHYDSTTHSLTYKGSKPIPVPLPGVHNASNLCGAICLAKSLGLTILQITKGLNTFTGATGRSELKIHQASGGKVLCDYYNSNPASLKAALKTLGSRPEPHKIAVLADMLELGPNELEFHKAVSKDLKECRIKNVLLFGPRMKHLFSILSVDGSFHPSHYNDYKSLSDSLLKIMTPDSITLIKGSRGMKLENVWSLINTEQK